MAMLSKIPKIVITFLAIYLWCLNQVSASDNETTAFNIPALTLNTGNKIPSIGYGTSRARDDELEKALDLALEAGYRHIDTAYFYQNEKAIGKVTKRWITEGKIERKDLFVVSKLPFFGNQPERVSYYLKKTLEHLQMEYVDLYLIHGPFGIEGSEENQYSTTPDGNIVLDTTIDHLALWKEMEKQQNSGLTKAIGLSNFNKTQIESILKKNKIPPSSLQIELHAYLQQNELVDFCEKHNILVTAYAPLGSRSMVSASAKRGNKVTLPDVLTNPTVKKIAEKRSKTEAQVVLRFDIQRGVIPIPKSSNPERLKQNLDIFDFVLDEEDIKALKSLDAGIRFFNFTSLKGVEKHPEYPFRNEVKESTTMNI